MKRILVKPARVRFPWMLAAWSFLAVTMGAGLVLLVGDALNGRLGENFNHLGELRFFITLPVAVVLVPLVAGSLVKGWLVQCRIVGLLYADSDGATVRVASFLGSRFRPQIEVPTGTTIYVEVTPKTPTKGSERKRDFWAKWEIFAGRKRIRFATYFDPDAEMIEDLCREFTNLGLVPKARIL